MFQKNLSRREFLHRACRGGVLLGGGVLLTLASQGESAKSQIGKCKRRGCRCPGFSGGYICSNCRHSNVDHL